MEREYLTLIVDSRVFKFGLSSKENTLNDALRIYDENLMRVNDKNER